MNVLCLVPHGDDEILSAGGSIAKHKRRGDKVTVCILKGDKDPRNAQQLENSKAVAEFLKIDKLHHLDVPESIISTDIKYVAGAIESFLLAESSYDILYTVSPYDNHQDHQGTYRAINVATRASGPFIIPQVLCGEILSSTEQTFGITRQFSPTYYNSLQEADINKKMEAFSFYTGELRQPPHPRSLHIIKALAELRGAECHQQYAEAFVVARQFVYE
jgi:LmbE family N-acetylglucosaminyl deacetylase